MAKYKFSPKDFEKSEVHTGTEKRTPWWKNWKTPLGIALFCGAGYGCYTLWNQSNEEVIINGSIVQVSHDSIPSPLENENMQDRVEQNKNPKTVDDENAHVDTSLAAQVEITAEETKELKEDSQIQDVAISSGTIEQKAKHVIRGDFGNGQVRKNKLGAEYETIQNKVNEMYRKGDLFM